MARTIKQIQSEITSNLTEKLSLSRSAAAEWRLWAYVIALAIHSFEVVMDLFLGDIERQIEQTRPGTLQWYTHMCYQFQNGHKLELVDGMLRYPIDSPESRIISIASVTASNDILVFRVAKNMSGALTPLSVEERSNFSNYIEAIAMAGDKLSIVSKEADKIKYSIDVYYDPAYPESIIRTNVEAALIAFNTNKNFGGIVYSQRLIESIIDVNGVVTAKPTILAHKSVTDTDYSDVDISVTLDAGYYNFADDSTLIMRTIKDLPL